MNKLLKIARHEFASLFFSPVGWVVLIVFAYQCGDCFTDIFKSAVREFRFHGVPNDGFTASFMRLFMYVQQNLYLYLPLLTMGLIAREIHSGSIKLLQSSPVKTWEIIMGKYLGMICYSLFFIAIIATYALWTDAALKHADRTLLLSGLLATYLLLCSYAAIGLFLSCLTSYQIVAAIGTFTLFAALNYVGELWPDKEVLGSIVSFLALAGRSQTLDGGLISSNDIYYFLAISALFLGYAVLVMKGRQKREPVLLQIARYTGLTTAIIVVGLLLSRPRFTHYTDLTQTFRNTLSDGSQEVLKHMDQQVTIKTYVNVLGDLSIILGSPNRYRQDRDFFERYQRFLAYPIKFEYVYYYDSCASSIFKNPAFKGKTLEQLRDTILAFHGLQRLNVLDSAEIRRQVDLKAEGNQYVRQLQYGNASAFLRIYADGQPSEAEISAAFGRVKNGAVKAALLTGHGERGLNGLEGKGYQLSTKETGYRYSLVNQGFEYTTIAANGLGQLPKGAILVIADPKISYTEAEQLQIRQYVEKGGNLLVAGEPGRQALLNPTLETLGLRLDTGRLLQRHATYPPELVIEEFAKNPAIHNPGWEALRNEGAGLVFNGVCAISPTGKSDFKQSFLVIHKESGKVVATAMSRKHNGREQRIVVSGDADIFSDAELMRQNIPNEAQSFEYAVYHWLSGGLFPVDMYRPKEPDNAILVTPKLTLLIKPFLVWTQPVLLSLLGAVILLKRKNK